MRMVNDDGEKKARWILVEAKFIQIKKKEKFNLKGGTGREKLAWMTEGMQ